ncbi:MAG: 50S ribosomal protein L29 [archaeon]|nr:50S ribosomal protein L29 [archaeon]
MRPRELREMGEDSLEEKLLELKTELSKQRGTISSGTKPESPGKIKKMRRDIARILTIMNEKQKTKIQKANKAEEKALTGEKKKFEIKKIVLPKKAEKTMPKKEEKKSIKQTFGKSLIKKPTGGKKKK